MLGEQSLSNFRLVYISWQCFDFHGRVRNNLEFLNHPLRLNIRPEIIWISWLLGELSFSQVKLLLFMLTTLEQFRLLSILFFMNCNDHIVCLPHISIDLQVADIFTKSLPRPLHKFLVDKLMLLDQPTSICGGIKRTLVKSIKLPKKPRARCDHYRKTGHSRDVCKLIHGRLADIKPSHGRNSRASTATATASEGDKVTTAPESSPFSKEWMEMLFNTSFIYLTPSHQFLRACGMSNAQMLASPLEMGSSVLAKNGGGSQGRLVVLISACESEGNAPGLVERVRDYVL
ncbi:hypothetical protein CR513_17668, partial [Mucuna pruriens]